MEPNRPEGEPGPPTESVTQQAAAAAKSAAKTAAKTAAKKAAKKAAKEGAKQAATAAAANPYVAAIIAVIVLVVGVLVIVGTVLMVGFLSGAVGDLYEEAETRPVCYDIPEGREADGAFDVSAHHPYLGNYQGVVGVVDGYPTCVDPRLIYILSDIAEAGFLLTKRGEYGITSHHFWVGAFDGGNNRYSSVCPLKNAKKGCGESPHKQGRGIDLFEIDGEIANPDEPYTVGDDEPVEPDLYILDDPNTPEDLKDIEEEEEKVLRPSRPQEMVEWLTCDYAPTATFGFTLVWSNLWVEYDPDDPDDVDALEEWETEPARFVPCDEPNGQFGFASDGDHTKHVHLDVRCGPRWYRPPWNPKAPHEGGSWHGDYVELRCGDDAVRAELADLLQILGLESST